MNPAGRVGFEIDFSDFLIVNDGILGYRDACLAVLIRRIKEGRYCSRNVPAGCRLYVASEVRDV